MFTVTDATTRDVPTILEVLRIAGHDVIAESCEVRLFEKIASQDGLAIVANDDDGRVIGFTMADYSGWNAVVWCISVFPSVAHDDVVRALRDTLVYRLKQRGATMLLGFVDSDDRAGIRRSELQGFIKGRCIRAMCLSIK